MQIRKKILDVIRGGLYREADLFVVGSTINGCGSFNADMDLCCSIDQPNFTGNERKFAMKTLYKIRALLIKHKAQMGMGNCLVIPAKVCFEKIRWDNF